MLEIYRQMEADGKIGPLGPPDSSGMRQPRPHSEYPKMLKPPVYERQERLEPGPGGSVMKLWAYVQTSPAVVARSRREELEFLQTGAVDAEPVEDIVVAERDALRMQNEDLTRRLERLESLLLAQTSATLAAAKQGDPTTLQKATLGIGPDVASQDAINALRGIAGGETPTKEATNG